MSRGLLALVPIFAGCSSPFLDSLSVLLHEVGQCRGSALPHSMSDRHCASCAGTYAHPSV